VTHVPPLATSASFTESEQDAWGTQFGAALPYGAVIALHGDLGAGKTTLARALCKGIGVDDLDAVTSPTFAIIHEYQAGDDVVVHADFYRLRDARDLENLGWDELLARARAVIVEWPDRVPDAIPADAVHLRLEHDAEHPDRRVVRRD
jgi:tRNA threonylcarbamoyladenosine biosynthesis protein TsaE